MYYLYAQGAHVNLKTHMLLLYYRQSTVNNRQMSILYFTFCDIQFVQCISVSKTFCTSASICVCIFSHMTTFKINSNL